ncbi:hypothetical protein RsTz2092_09370 [Deferribacterales bacterium RsTz2092]|nr:hypothetical protein AGMMS49941_12930 [Deferribacterales bacterium]
MGKVVKSSTNADSDYDVINRFLRNSIAWACGDMLFPNHWNGGEEDVD